MNQCVLVLFVPLALEDAVVDWLLAREEIGGFFSSSIDGHGLGAERLSIAEQVTGRQRMKLVEVSMTRAAADKVVVELRTAFGSAQMRFRLLDVLDGGTL